ncbi:hypothetical protein N0V88_007648 [Collariella sp. IMI 366227]|nr:hypothetical protein N0V88_007648 [Collariella sp. IMI 366227]
MNLLRYLALLASSATVFVDGRVLFRRADDVCKPEDRTYSTEAMPPANFMGGDNINPLVGKLGKKFYIAIVNLTPDRFYLQGTHSYQMDTFEFGHVPQGRARQNTVKYRGTLHTKDDAGEVYYRIERTTRNFVVRVKSQGSSSDSRRVIMDLTGMGLGQREYVFPSGETSVTLVITGSENLGYLASIRHGPGNWMKTSYSVIHDRPVRHLIMPGTHNAGMSKITGKITSIGSEHNTQNQGINIYDQLRTGARWFDLRVASIHPNSDQSKINGFWTMHVNNETAPLVIGNTGESFDDVISEVNRFTFENPGEIIFFTLRYLLGRYELPDRGPILWDDKMLESFFAKLRTINNRCGNLSTSTGFQNQKASYFMNQNDGKGCVLLLLNGQHIDEAESPADGIYNVGRIDYDDHWSEMEEAADIATDQITNWRSKTRGGKSDHGRLMIAQWIASPDALASTAYGLQRFAIQPTNPALYFAGVNGMDPEHWPNVLLVDYIGVQEKDEWAWEKLSAEIYTLTVGLNLYMASENCDLATLDLGAAPLPHFNAITILRQPLRYVFLMLEYISLPSIH